MKIQICSDLHLEINKNQDYDSFLKPIAPILFLAGDIGDCSQTYCKNFFKWISENFKKSFLVAGNHEYYSIKDHMNMHNKEQLLRNVINQFNNIVFLDNEYYEMDNYIVLGTTLWSYIKPNEENIVSLILNDFNHIYLDKNKKLDIKTYNNLYKKNYAWLRNQINKFSNKNIIILTHHLPTFLAIDNKYKNCGYNSAFASHSEELIKENVKYWIFGHSHSSKDLIVNNCRLIANPHGYGSTYDENNKYITENSNYKKDFIIKLN